MTRQTDRMVRFTLPVIALLLALIALRPLVNPETRAQAQASRFDHIAIISPAFIYKGGQGLLLMDKRNGNVWFMPKGADGSANAIFMDPVFIIHLPFEKLDQAPR
jgi:hypothetical protein